MRSLALLLLLSACGGPPPGEAANGAAAPAPGEPDRRILCRVGAMTAFERRCSVERAERSDVLIVRHPDGGFRRLRAAGGTMVAADGAQRANVIPLDAATIEVEIGGDRYRLAR